MQHLAKKCSICESYKHKKWGTGITVIAPSNQDVGITVMVPTDRCDILEDLSFGAMEDEKEGEGKQESVGVTDNVPHDDDIQKEECIRITAVASR